MTPKKGAYAGFSSAISIDSRVFTGVEDSVELFYTKLHGTKYSDNCELPNKYGPSGRRSCDE